MIKINSEDERVLIGIQVALVIIHPLVVFLPYLDSKFCQPAQRIFHLHNGIYFHRSQRESFHLFKFEAQLLNRLLHYAT